MSDFFRREWFAPAVVFAFGLAIILAAWGFQIIGGYVPCALCLEQRIPYYAALPVVLLAVIAAFVGSKPIAVRALLVIAAVIFAVNVYLGIYQAGAEWKLWEGPASCGATSAAGQGSLLEQIQHIRIVSCTEASWRFLFLSFAGWNAIVSAALVLVALWGAFRPLPAEAAHARA
jgi:disulfide bond formation protein DsbB